MNSPEQNLCNEHRFETFYKNHIQAISNFAFFKTGNQALSLDLIQDAFSKIWENCSKIDVNKAKTYLYTTVNNMFLDSVRHQKVVMTYAKDQPYIDQMNQDPEYILQEKEFKQKLQNAISDLTEDQREVFLLNRIEGKKYREIAELLEISQKTVEKRMSGALKLLRKNISGI